MELDKDLLSIQEVRNLAKVAKEAQAEFKHFNQEQVDKVVKAMAEAGLRESERLAKLAHEETGFGKWEDKKLKNEFGSKWVYESIKDLKTVGVIGVEENGKLVKIAEPMGVVAALIPSTNPTSTAFYKALISVKARNAIIASPHPKAIKCTTEAMNVMAEAAEKAGAPKGLIQTMSLPTMQGTKELMHNENVSVILATGGMGMVKAAYSAGKPAYGVGPGNVPAFIERTADYKKAVADIIAGTTFDYGTLCSSEQAIIVDRPLREKVIEEAKKLNAYFVNEEEKKLLESKVTKNGKINADIVGKSAAFIADYAGFSVPDNTSVLIAECTKVGKEEPLSIEKLSPMLSFYTVDGWLEGCHRSIELLQNGGMGHTLVIHSNDKEIIMKFALEKPAFRIVVNTLSSLGAVGYTTPLMPSMTLGPGTIGGSIISENVTAKHLMNIKTLAFETNPINKGNTVNSFTESKISTSTATATNNKSYLKEIEERLKARAGNPSVEPFQNSFAAKSEVKEDLKLGSDISKSEIDKIIEEFNKE